MTTIKMKKSLVSIIIIIMFVLVLLPIKITCGAPGLLCASGVDSFGRIHYYYEIEPLGISLLEHITQKNIPLYYHSGYYFVKVRK